MRNKIKPRWEHNDNKDGGKYTAIIHNIVNTNTRILFGNETFGLLSYLMVNEVLNKNNDIINGISFIIKNKFTNIQIWWKDYDKNCNNKIIEQEVEDILEQKYIEINNSIPNKKIIRNKLFKLSKILHE